MNKTRTVMNCCTVPQSFILNHLVKKNDDDCVESDLMIRYVEVVYKAWSFEKPILRPLDATKLHKKLCLNYVGLDEWVNEYVSNALNYFESNKHTIYPYLYFVELIRREGTKFDHQHLLIKHAIFLLHNAGISVANAFTIISYDFGKVRENTSKHLIDIHYIIRIFEERFPEYKGHIIIKDV